ncbi:hypothetical protein D3C72_1701080 [compost metagenome]
MLKLLGYGTHDQASLLYSCIKLLQMGTINIPYVPVYSGLNHDLTGLGAVY